MSNRRVSASEFKSLGTRSKN